nr:GNAT family protein [Variovorax terrae]
MRLLDEADGPSLLAAAFDGELWSLPFTIVPSHETIDDYIRIALSGHAAGTGIPFVIELISTGKIIGSTRFWNADISARTIEISHTWLAFSYQRTFVNTEVKYLMLQFAFEQLACIRVQFRVDETNSKSRTAVLRLGAKEEGLIRHERVMPDGRKRNALLYSIVDDEWPAIKSHLRHRLML